MVIGMCSGVGGSLSLKDALSKADPAELQRPGLPGGGAQALWAWQTSPPALCDTARHVARSVARAAKLPSSGCL